MEDSQVSKRFKEALNDFVFRQNNLSKDILILNRIDKASLKNIKKMDNIYTSIRIKFLDSFNEGYINKVYLKFDSKKGNLPNFDLVNTTIKLLKMRNFDVSLKKVSFISSSIGCFFRKLFAENEDTYLSEERINSISLVIDNRRVWKDLEKRSMDDLYSTIESLVQSLNNLEERFHQSLFFYQLIDTNYFLKITTYFLGTLILCIPFFIHIISLLFREKYTEDDLIVIILMSLLSICGSSGNELMIYEVIKTNKGNLWELIISLEILITLAFKDISSCYLFGLTKIILMEI